MIHLGGQTEVSDEMFLSLTEANHLQQLEEIQIERSASLSLRTLNCLLSHCNSIRSVGDLAAWAGVTGQELGEMIQIVHEQNLALDLSSHQVRIGIILQLEPPRSRCYSYYFLFINSYIEGAEEVPGPGR